MRGVIFKQEEFAELKQSAGINKCVASSLVCPGDSVVVSCLVMALCQYSTLILAIGSDLILQPGQASITIITSYLMAAHGLTLLIMLQQTFQLSVLNLTVSDHRLGGRGTILLYGIAKVCQEISIDRNKI